MILPSRVLVTGAQVGLGMECARQLAENNVPQVVLACYDPEVALQTKQTLQAGKTTSSKFETVIMDLTDSNSVRETVEQLQGPIDGLVLNAGGILGNDNRLQLTKDGVTNIAAVNLLGHVLLVDLLLKQNKLTGSVILAGSEAARGEPRFSLPRPDLKSGSVEEMKSILNGSFFKGKDSEHAYGYIKLLGALWMSHMARKRPDIRFVTVSPGGCSGTAISQGFPLWKRLLLGILIPTMVFFRIMHRVEDGAQRYVDALVDGDRYQTGSFWASESGLQGPTIDQSTLSDSIFKNEILQQNADAAIHSFITD